eukprot:6955158-Lingulodinium_polyedra.AAC.1
MGTHPTPINLRTSVVENDRRRPPRLSHAAKPRGVSGNSLNQCEKLGKPNVRDQRGIRFEVHQRRGVEYPCGCQQNEDLVERELGVDERVNVHDHCLRPLPPRNGADQRLPKWGQSPAR